MAFTKWRKFRVGLAKGRAGFVGLQKQAIAVVGNVGAGEDDLQTVTCEAKSLYANGQAWRIRVAGRVAANANAKTVKLYVGGTAILTTGALAANNKPWWVEATVYRTALDTQVAFAWGVFNDALIVPQRTALTKDDDASIIVKATGEGVATDDIQCDYLGVYVETV